MRMWSKENRWLRRAFFRAGARAVRRKVEKYLSFSQVHNVGVGQKMVKGKPADCIALVAFVENKQVRPKKPLPKRIRMNFYGKSVFVKTDVRQVPLTAKTCSLMSGDTIFAGGRGFPSFPGTCSAAWLSTGNPYLVTCAHLFFDPADPSHATYCEDSSLHEIGIVDAWTVLSAVATNRGDAALVRLYDGVQVGSQEVGGEVVGIVAFGDIEPSRNDYFYVHAGEKFPCTSPVQPSEPWSVTHRGRNLAYSDMWILNMPDARKSIQPGHSGSMMFRRSGSGVIAVGIVFAMANSSTALVYSVRDMYHRLGLDV